jgi:hypothetical protein
MNLGMSLTPSLRQIQQCHVCKQEHDRQKANVVAFEAHVYGSVAFAICPCCGLQAPNMTAKAYLARAAAWIQQRSLEELRQKLGRCKAMKDGDCDFAQCPQQVVHLTWCPLWVEDEEA